MKIPLNKASLLKEQLRKDAVFFANNMIIDYSFLIGIHQYKKAGELASAEFQVLREFSSTFKKSKITEDVILLANKQRK